MVYKKQEFVNGIFWSAIDKFGIVAVQIILEIVMARLLLPSDYGVLGVVAVFIAIGQVFTDGGFSNALIQKQDRTEIDFSTVFFSNIAIATVIYCMLFFSAPFIAVFYNLPILSSIIRVICVAIIINAAVIVHRTKLSISLDFKVQAKYSLLSVTISGAIGLFLALHGYGVWSLVYQSVLLYTFNAVFLFLHLKWTPIFIFSKKSFNELFYFGSKILIASFIQAIYNNLYSVLIAKKFSTKELGLYSKSNQFTLFPISTLTSMMQRVAFPYLSSYQNDGEKLFSLNQKFTKMNLLLIAPFFFGLSALAEPFVRIVFSDTWIEIIPLIRILAIAYVFYPVIVNNMYLFQIMNKPKVYLALEVVTKISGILILLLTMKYGIVIMAFGLLTQQFLQLIITSVYLNKLLGKSVFIQLKMIVPHILICFVILSITLFGVNFMTTVLLKLLVGLALTVMLYFVFYFCFLKAEIKELYSSFKK
ncbi:lipopolysaccharide biosynthesis protein [Flavobacterium restrictum]|uniref:Lipopolysaccharide biosynthesis protein n=1 Tax=Flavobacterium restrictum TaxID=2594428 RepID=A0A553E590_9FLAO|nr:lipopolysaccharide biosynthesis protein [Flavobacterium restrictum]TRX40132.1 lipopolysaccharide biosynthesis protein [Flavobacterium restrictum]